MKIQGQYDNTHKSSLGLLNDNKEVDHLWNISGAVTQAKEHHQIPSKCRGLTFFHSQERYVWCAWARYGGADAIQSPKIVYWDLTKGFKILKQLSNDSRAEEHGQISGKY